MWEAHLLFTAFHLPFAAFARGSVPAVQPEYNTGIWDEVGFLLGVLT